MPPVPEEHILDRKDDMTPKSTVGPIRAISVRNVPDGQERNGVDMSGHRGTTGTTARRRDPIVAVVHDEPADPAGGEPTTDGRRGSWVFIAESGARTRLVLGPRQGSARTAPSPRTPRETREPAYS